VSGQAHVFDPMVLRLAGTEHFPRVGCQPTSGLSEQLSLASRRGRPRRVPLAAGSLTAGGPPADNASHNELTFRNPILVLPHLL